MPRIKSLKEMQEVEMKCWRENVRGNLLSFLHYQGGLIAPPLLDKGVKWPFVIAVEL